MNNQHHAGSSKIIQVYEEQYKGTMVHQEVDEAKVVEGEWHTKSNAP